MYVSNTFEAVLREIAMKLPPSVVRKAVDSMRKKIADCYRARGGNIAND